MTSGSWDAVVVGAGPAGMAAACSASESGAKVLLLDDNPAPGGQIWRSQSRGPWFDRLSRSAVQTMNGVRAIGGDAASKAILIEQAVGTVRATYRKLILATGARELFLPFPGWTLPNVMGVGGLQAMVKGGMPVADKRVVIAGSGPLLLAVAAFLRGQNARVLMIAEQAPAVRIRRFARELLRFPSKLIQGARLRAQVGSVPYLKDCWVEAASGTDRLRSVKLRQGEKRWDENCDMLGVGFGLVPNIELAMLMGCQIHDGGFVSVNANQQTSVADVYCAGEPTGIGGVDCAVIEGQIAGWHSAGQADRAAALHSQRAKLARFAEVLERSFAPRAELHALAEDETIVCRCEDVRFGQLKGFSGWRPAKLMTRCGMGPCQGRVCGPAVRCLLGWKSESVREPVFPARAGSLMADGLN